MQYVPLGTSASRPTKGRGCPGGLLLWQAEKAILDCGEGTTRQMAALEVSLQKVTLIWLSHSHLDHWIGLAGIMHALCLQPPSETIPVFGNNDTIAKVSALARLCGVASDKVQTQLVRDGVFHEREGIEWRAFPVDHTVPTSGIVIEEKPHRSFLVARAEELGVPPGPMRARLTAGESVLLPNGRKVSPEDCLGPTRPGRKVVYVGDTAYFNGLSNVCRGADLLICESTYLARDVELAKKHKHMTALEAASLAAEAGAQQLLLTHISPRAPSYEIEKEASRVFKPTSVAKDLCAVQIGSAGATASHGSQTGRCQEDSTSKLGPQAQ